MGICFPETTLEIVLLYSFSLTSLLLIGSLAVLYMYTLHLLPSFLVSFPFLSTASLFFFVLLKYF